ncbi:EAL domain-containing protein [Roseibium sp. FZY0029]|uniref:EAL domain-containing protein n=1 Tax=Roseibium sp. FZY0029 TaxID=3116647 RepID=UPI002E9BB5AF|nr:EAL domain-containing protein [Roseibium sp. FZY0029]
MQDSNINAVYAISSQAMIENYPYKQAKEKNGTQVAVSASRALWISSVLGHWSDKMFDIAGILQKIFASSPSKIGVFDCNGQILLANNSLQADLNVTAEQIHGKNIDDFPQCRYFLGLKEAIQKTAVKGRPTDLEFPFEDSKGEVGVHTIRLMPILGDDNKALYVILYSQRSTYSETLNPSFAGAEDQLHAAVRVLPDIFWIKDTKGRYLLCNEEFDRFNNIARNSALGKKASDLSTGTIYEIHRMTDEQALSSTEPVRFELEIPANEINDNRFYEIQKIAIRDSEGKISGLLGLARDVTSQRKLENDLRTREREYRHLVEHLPDNIIRYDPNLNPVYMNTALINNLRDALGEDLGILINERKATPANEPAISEFREIVSHVLKHGRPQITETVLKRPDGEEIVFEVRLIPEFDDNGETTSVLGIGRDITAKKIAERQLASNQQELRRLAFTDDLTGLANRASFTTTLTEHLKRATNKEKKIALLIIDIDRLKTINDTLGHAAGDVVLQRMARQLQNVADTAAWIGRLGGDEFALILSDLDSAESAEQLAGQLIQEACLSMALEGNTINVDLSIGIAIAPDDSSHPDALFRQADIALYSAKGANGGCFCRYDEGMSRAINRRFEMEAMINEGLRLDQFVAHFQPKITLATLEVRGAEALCRWRHQERGMIPPGEFISVAEETGQIIEIGKRILQQACEVAVECNRHSAVPIVIAVNVSARQLIFGGFLGALVHCLEATGCKASWIELEITESLLLIEDETIVETLESISRLGIIISLDDFGTGYSSLSYLQKFPISGLKIDQSFIREVEKSSKQEALVRTILTMAQSLGLKTVAEGIETSKTAAWLTDLGCTEGQGYLWHHPMPASNLIDLIESCPLQMNKR